LELILWEVEVKFFGIFPPLCNSNCSLLLLYWWLNKDEYMLKVYFLNVGHGNCTIIEHESGNVTMIDINNGTEIDEESAEEIVEQLGYQLEQLIKIIESSNLTPYEILQKAGYTTTLTNPIQFYTQKFGTKEIFLYIQTHPDMDHLRGLVAL